MSQSATEAATHPSPADSYDVVINGGGPVGMALALELGLRGVRTAVVERYPTPQAVPKGQNLTQRTAEHFARWGVGDALFDAHATPKGIGGQTNYGTLLGDYPSKWLEREKVKPFYSRPNARLPQYATEAVIRARVAELDSVELLYNYTGTALAEDAEGVTLTITPRQGGADRQIRGKYLVGADGSHSFVRNAAGITQSFEDHRKLMALLVFTSEELDRLLTKFPDRAFYNVLRPSYEGYWLFFGRVDHGKSWFFHCPVPHDTTAENFDFKALLHDAVGQEFDLTIDYIGFWDLRFAIADQYRKGRIFVAGDAAHAHPPYGGYGINSGLEDAVNLGWKLAAVLKGQGGEALLDSYHTERHGVFRSTIDDFIARFIRQDREFLATHDEAADPEAFRKAWYERAADDRAVVNFVPHYQGSPVVGDSEGSPSAFNTHEMAARAGHHLAPATLEDGTNAFFAVGCRHTLFALKGADPAAVAALEAEARALGLDLAVRHDGGDSARETYGASLVLVRPDEFVIWAGNGAAPEGILARSLGR